MPFSYSVEFRLAACDRLLRCVFTVLMVKVAVNEPVSSVCDFAEKFAGEGNEFAPLTFCLIEPSRYFRSDGSERRRRGSP